MLCDVRKFLLLWCEDVEITYVPGVCFRGEDEVGNIHMLLCRRTACPLQLSSVVKIQSMALVSYKISVWGMWLSVFFTSKDRRYFPFLFTTTFAFTNLNIVRLNILVIDSCKMCTMGPSDWNNVRNFENRGNVALRKCNCIRKAGSWVILRILL